MKNQQKKATMPTRQEIANWWANTSEGQARILDIKERLDINLFGSLGCIEIDTPHCWACDKTLRRGRSNYNSKDLGLHRCHVIPRAHGGSNHPSNLVLMCTDCHKDNPDLKDEFGFWWWFSNVDSHIQKSIRLLSAAIPKEMQGMCDGTAEELLHITKQVLEEERPVLVQGSMSMGSMVSIVAKAVRMYKQGENSLRLESY